MAQVNLQLGIGQLPGPSTRRSNANVGQGLVDIGTGMTNLSKTLFDISKESLKEDPSLSLEWYQQKASELDALEMELKSQYTDPFLLTLAMNEGLQKFTHQARSEMLQLGIPKKGTEMLSPRLALARSNLSEHRTKISIVAGEQKMNEAKEKFKSDHSNIPVVIEEVYTDTGSDGQGRTGQSVRPVIRIPNENKVVSDIFQYTTALHDIGRKYGVPVDKVQKFIGDSQEEFFSSLQQQAINTIPEQLIDPKYNNLSFEIHQVVVDSITGEASTIKHTLEPKEAASMLDGAYKVVRDKQAREEELRKQTERLQNQQDDETASELMVNFPSFTTVSSVMDAIQDGTPLNGVTYQFHRPENKRKFLDTLRSIRASGGFGKESDQETLQDLEARAMTGDLIDPLEVAQSIPLLRQDDYLRLAGLVKENRQGVKTEFQHNLKEQHVFVDDFWGNLTNYIGIFDKEPAALALKSKTSITNKALALPLEQRTRENLTAIAQKVLLDEAKTAVKNKFNITQLSTFQRLSTYKDANEIEKANLNSEDRKLAHFLLSLKKFKQEAVDEAEAQNSKEAPQSGSSFMDDIKKKFSDKIGEIFKSMGIGF